MAKRAPSKRRDAIARLIKKTRAKAYRHRSKENRPLNVTIRSRQKSMGDTQEERAS